MRLTSPASRAFSPNLVPSVRKLSFVSLLFKTFFHPVVASPSMLLRSSPSSSRFVSFLIFHIRYAISETIILYSLFFPSSGLSLVVRFARPHPRISLMLVGSGCRSFPPRGRPLALDISHRPMQNSHVIVLGMFNASGLQAYPSGFLLMRSQPPERR